MGLQHHVCDQTQAVFGPIRLMLISTRAERGLKSGDVILEAGGKPVTNPADVRDALSAARKDGKSVILLRVKGEDGNRFVTLPVGQG